jgi:hypothetical protein
MIMAINYYFWVVLLLAVLAPGVPWTFAVWRDSRAAWMSVAIYLPALAVLAFLFLPACMIADCREGTMAFLPLWLAVAISIVATIVSAAIATLLVSHFWHR